MFVSKKRLESLEKRVDELEREKVTSTTLQEVKRAVREVLEEIKPSPKIFPEQAFLKRKAQDSTQGFGSFTGSCVIKGQIIGTLLSVYSACRSL